MSAFETVLGEQVLAPLQEALAELEPAERGRLRAMAAQVAASSAAVWAASGAESEAQELLRKAEGLSEGELSQELAAAGRHLDWWLRLALARSLIGQDRPRAEKLLQAIRRGAPELALRACAEQVLAEPRPIKSGPPLFTLNGFGVRLYGRRDPHPDGSFISTLYLTALFVPLLPLAAYRVFQQEGNRYLFLGKVPLSRGQRFYLKAVAAAAVLALVATGVQDYLGSPSRLAGQALEQARATEQSGKREAALAAYDHVLRQFGQEALSRQLEEAAEGWLRLKLGTVQEPSSPHSVEEAERMVRWFRQAPARAQGEAARKLLGEKLQGWSSQLGAGKTPQVRGALRLLELAKQVAPEQAPPGLRTREGGLRRQLALELAPEWPLLALEQYLRTEGDPEAPLQARLHRERGDSRRAASILDALGKPGRLSAEAQMLLASCYADLGRGGEAEAVKNRLVEDARAGRLPADLPSWITARGGGLGSAPLESESRAEAQP